MELGITKLHGPAKWTQFYLYVILDIFSRYPVGWMVASREYAVLAERLIAEAVRKQQIDRGQLTLHADRGSSMASKPVAFLLADLGVTKSHSRPHCSNDNPFSEAQFKTLKYRPDFPERFGSIEDARAFCDRLFGCTPTNIGTPGSGSTLPLTSTTATPRCPRGPRPFLDAAHNVHPRGSSGSHHSHRNCPAPSGSTSPRTRRNRHSDYFKNVSQKGWQVPRLLGAWYGEIVRARVVLQASAEVDGRSLPGLVCMCWPPTIWVRHVFVPTPSSPSSTEGPSLRPSRSRFA